MNNNLINELYYTGTQVNYYFHCHRQLWLFSHHITCEQNSDTVYMGKLIHEHSYDREKKEIEIDHLKFDFIDFNNKIVHEVKKSDSFEEAHQWQLLFYLYYLKVKGLTDYTGELNYPEQRKKIKIKLTDENEKQLLDILLEIKNVVQQEKMPDKIEISICRKCSYYELCWIE